MDVGPSLGALNRSVLLNTDGFLTPMGSDVFSLLEISNIENWIDDWKFWRCSMICEGPPKLVAELANRRAIIFVGSGLTSSCLDEKGNRPFFWDTFIKNFIDKI